MSYAEKGKRGERMVAIMFNRLILVCLSATLLLTSCPVYSAGYPEIEYAYPDQSVWTTRLDAQGRLDNPLLRLAEVLFKEAGIAWYAKPYPAKRMFRRLIEQVTPFSMLVRAPSLKDCCLFSEKPVTFTELRVYHRRDVPGIQQKEQLNGKRVIVIQGYSYGGIGRYLRDQKNGIQINVAPNHESAFGMLDRRRGDYVLDYTGPSEEVLADSPIPGITHDVMATLNVYLVLAKNYPDAEQVMAKLEAIVDRLDVPALLRRE